MAELPLQSAIPRFKANEARMNDFINGDETETWSTSGGEVHPTAAKLIRDTIETSEGLAPRMDTVETRLADQEALHFSLLSFGFEPGSSANNGAATEALMSAIANSPDAVTVIVPRGAWFLDRQIYVDRSNVHFVVDGYLARKGGAFDALNPPRVLFFEGTAETPLTGCGLSGVGQIDGMGQSVTGYTYAAGERYDAVTADRVRRFEASNLRISNGLVSCLKTWKSRETRMMYLRADGSVHDNCLAITQDPDDFVEGNSRTWANGLMVGCDTWGARDFGQTVFNATGCTIASGRAWGCGTQEYDASTGKYSLTGGGMSVECGPTVTRDLRAKIISPIIRECRNNGITVTANNTHIESPDIDMLVNGATPQSDQIFEGHGISQFSAYGLRIGGVGRIRRSYKHGISSIAGSYGGERTITSLEISGSIEISDNAENGVYGYGVSRVLIGNDVAVQDNGASNGDIFITNKDSVSESYNEGNGEANIHCRVRSSKRSVQVKYLNRALLSGITGDNNITAAAAPLNAENIADLVVTDCHIGTGSASKPANILTTTDCTSVKYWGLSGDYTGQYTAAITGATTIVRSAVEDYGRVLTSGGTITIASGVLTPFNPRGLYIVDTEGGAATDDMTQITISGAVSGQIIRLRAANAARVTTILHASAGGNIRLKGGGGSSLTLTNTGFVSFIYDATSGLYFEA